MPMLFFFAGKTIRVRKLPHAIELRAVLMVSLTPHHGKCADSGLGAAAGSGGSNLKGVAGVQHSRRKAARSPVNSRL